MLSMNTSRLSLVCSCTACYPNEVKHEREEWPLPPKNLVVSAPSQKQTRTALTEKTGTASDYGSPEKLVEAAHKAVEEKR